eukprot:scaffold122041_cov63-Phaeocystis_antarctica.AAC.3
MACVTKRPKAKKYCDNAGHFAGCLVFTIALSCALFTLYMNSEEYRDGSVEIDCSDTVKPDRSANPPEMCKLDMGAAMKTFGYARMVSVLARALGLESAPHQQKCPATARARGCALERSWCQRLRPSPSPSTSPSCRGRALPRASSLSCSCSSAQSTSGVSRARKARWSS